MRTRKIWLATGLATSAAVAAATTARPLWAPDAPVGEQRDGASLTSTHQRLTPTGVLRRLDGARPKAIAIAPDGRRVAVLAQGSVRVYAADDATPIAEVPQIDAGPLGIAWAPDGNTLYASQGKAKIAVIYRRGADLVRGKDLSVAYVGPDTEPDVAAGTQGRGKEQGDPQLTGMAVSGDGARLFVARGIRNDVAVVDPKTGAVESRIPVGVAPYHVALSPDGATLAVACRGGRAAAPDDESAESAGTKVRVDPKTDAALSGAIALVDTKTRAVRRIDAGRQPSGLAFSRDGKTLWAASSDDDTLLKIDVPSASVAAARTLRPARDPGFGQIPTDIALSADEKTVYVACGGANAVAAVDARSGKIRGYIPTGWFPIALARSGEGLFIASSKGYGGRVRRDKPAPSFGVHSTVGLIQRVSLPAVDLSAGARTVADNNRWGQLERPARADAAPRPVPERVGEPSLFRHVVFVIKENQTYDGVFGDMPEGNGDPRLCTFPEETSPNHHALAREFVLLDNTYTSGTNSADGHQWTVSGIANGYMEQNYAAHTRSYPYDGGDPLAYSPQGFLWNAALAQGKSLRVYGEFVNKPVVKSRLPGTTATWANLWADYKATGLKNFDIRSATDNAALRPHLHPRYIGFPSTVPDQWRADQFLADVERFERAGTMPNLSILLLPNDHTQGTRAGGPTPRAAVADNDLALGRIVDRLSRSSFWKETLILVIEDDSQYGIDHVDGHRTVALCVSPYTRRGAVVHTQYDHTSLLRTMELVLGLPAMNRFDRTATAMTDCFTRKADLRPYTVRPSRVSLTESNPPATALRGEAKRLTEASNRLDWDDVDRADAAIVARAIWLAQRPGVPFPTADFHPSGDDDDWRPSPDK